MNSKQIKGISVISIVDGERLGSVDNVYFDPATMQVVGFAIRAHGGLLGSGTGTIVDVTSVRSLGPDVMTIPDKAAAGGATTSAEYGHLVLLDRLVKRRVVTEGGVFVGQVASLDFDDKAFKLTQIEVSPGFFNTNRSVPVGQVISIGHDVVVVADAVCAADELRAAESEEEAPRPGATVEYYPPR